MRNKILNDLSYDDLLIISDYLEKRIKGLNTDVMSFEERIKSVIQVINNSKSDKELLRALAAVNELIVSINENKHKETTTENIGEEIGTYRILDTHNGFVFVLVAEDGQIIAESNIYSTKEGCEKGILSFQKNVLSQLDLSAVQTTEARKNPKIEIYKDQEEHYLFRVIASNGEVLMNSHSFGTLEECLKRIERVKILSKTQLTEKW